MSEREMFSRCVCVYARVRLWSAGRSCDCYYYYVCVIKPSPLLAIRITLEQSMMMGSGCYCLFFGSLTTTIFHSTPPKPIFPICYATIPHIHTSTFCKTSNISVFGWMSSASSNLSVFSFESRITISSHCWYFRIVLFFVIFFLRCFAPFSPAFSHFLMSSSVFDFRWLVP